MLDWEFGPDRRCKIIFAHLVSTHLSSWCEISTWEFQEAILGVLKSCQKISNPFWSLFLMSKNLHRHELSEIYDEYVLLRVEKKSLKIVCEQVLYFLARLWDGLEPPCLWFWPEMNTLRGSDITNLGPVRFRGWNTDPNLVNEPEILPNGTWCWNMILRDCSRDRE